ncbi:MAG: thioredoxin domain-containing protein [Acidobacteria bacterium]|nr:thioredoxin domain-containing protein [Acidobacteriota bacterium]
MKGSPKKKQPTLVLMVLALAVALWSTFLWWELVQARSQGVDPFCAFGDPGACGKLWDAAFASLVHRWSGVPVAGWGVIWGLAAAAVAAWVRWRGGPPRALRWLAVGGLAAMAGLVAASAAEGLFCSSCSVVYLLTAAFGWLALSGDGGQKAGSSGWPLTLGAVAVAYLVVLVPGLRTPRSTAGEARRALETAAQAATASAPVSSPSPLGSGGGGGLPERFTHGPGTGDEIRDRQLAALIESLPPELRQAMSDLLVTYDRAPVFPEGTPRALDGSPAAPVRIVEFTDTLCSHCAALHDTLDQLKRVAPPGSFSVDRRYYPLDGNCNRTLPVRGPESVRCLTARAKICMENRPGDEAFVADLYREQEQLTEERFWQLASQYSSRSELEVCIADSATATHLAEDVELAARYQPRGTPLVVINGKEAGAFPPFLYALILTGGSVSHPAFSALPAPSL